MASILHERRLESALQNVNLVLAAVAGDVECGTMMYAIKFVIKSLQISLVCG